MATEVVPMQATTPEFTAKNRRDKALEDYRKRLIDHKELDDKLKKSEEVVIRQGPPLEYKKLL